jgi:hypothetical protein
MGAVYLREDHLSDGVNERIARLFSPNNLDETVAVLVGAQGNEDVEDAAVALTVRSRTLVIGVARCGHPRDEGAVVAEGWMGATRSGSVAGASEEGAWVLKHETRAAGVPAARVGVSEAGHAP